MKQVILKKKDILWEDSGSLISDLDLVVGI